MAAMAALACLILPLVSVASLSENFFELVVGLPFQRIEVLDELFWNISTPGASMFPYVLYV